MSADIPVTGAIVISRKLTLDLNGKTISRTSGNNPIVVNSGGDLTLTSSVADGKVTALVNTIYVGNGGTGTFTLDSENVTIEATNSQALFVGNGSTSTVNSGTITATSGTGVRVYADSEFNMSGGTVTATSGTGIQINASNAEKSINLSGGNINAKWGVCNFSTGATVNVSGTNITGTSLGFQLSSGSLKMSGGSIKNTDGTSVYADGTSVDVSGSAYIEGATGISGINGASITMSGGEVKCSKKYGAVQLGQNTASYAPTIGDSFTMTGGKITGESGVNLFNGGAKFEMSGGEIETTSFAVSNNGNSWVNPPAEITIKGGTITSTGGDAPAIYHAGAGTTNIEGGTIKGASGIEIRAGELNVTGGTIEATAEAYESKSATGGSSSKGAGIAIAQHTTKKAITLSISGNNTNISGANALAVSNPQNNDGMTSTTGAVSATISGGTLKSTATASSSSSQNGNAILANNANVNITVTDGNLDGNVTVSKNTNATANTNDTTVKMEGGTTTGTVKVVEVDGTTETTKTDANAKEALQVSGGTYTDTVSANNYTDADTEISSDGKAVNKGAGWTVRESSDNKVYDYIVSSGGADATLITATFADAPAASLSVLKDDATNKLLGVDDSATYTWSSTASIASLQGNYALAKFTASGNAITITPQAVSLTSDQTYRGVKISGTGFIGTATALTASLGTGSGFAASLHGITVDATNNSLTKITGGDGNDNLLAGNRNTTLDGGNGDNILQGGTGNDSLKGGTGKDVFYYTAGNDTVNNFGMGDIVRTTLSAVTDGSKLTTVTGGFKLTFSNKNSLTFTDATVPVSLSDGSSSYIYTQDLVKQGSGVTLGANASTFNGTDNSLSSVITVDGSAVTGNLDLTDNTNANYLVAGKGKNTFNLKGGHDTIVGYDTVDVVNIDNLTTAPPTSFDNVQFTDSDYTINFDSTNSLMFKTASQIVLTNSTDTYTYNRNSIAQEGKGITLGSAYSDKKFNGKSSANSGYETIDAALVKGALDITGNDKANVIYGGQGGGKLLGGDANDTLVATSVGTYLNGGAEADSLVGYDGGGNVFIYTGGDDTIKNYIDDKDLVSVAAGINIADATVSTSGSGSPADLVIGFDTGDSLTFEGGASSTISLKSGRHDYLFSAQSITSGKGITLTAGYTPDDNTPFSEGDAYDTIDAHLVGKAISITGNNNGNYIVGGTSGGSLFGGDGNDTLVGGNGNDIFRYTAGKDVIVGFNEGTNDTDRLSIDTDNIVKAKASSRKLTFTMNNKANTLVFRATDAAPTLISLASNEGYLTKDGVVSLPSSGTNKSLKLFSSAKGRIDLNNDTLYSTAGIASVSAADVAKQSVTLVGGSTGGGTFTFADGNKKRDGFEYNGGKVTIGNYESGKDRINLGDFTISGFKVEEKQDQTAGDVVISLGSGDPNVISLTSAAGSEMLIHQSTNRGNSYSKMVFSETGVVYDKAKTKATSATIWGGMTEGEGYDPTGATKLKKIKVRDGDVTNISIQAGGNNTLIDASLAGAGVSLYSGDKNDKFIGSSHEDMFVYTAGKDIIQGFGDGDSISLSGGNELKLEDAKITSGKKSIKFKFEGGSKNTLTIKPTKNATLSGALNINGEERIYGKNFIASGTNVSLTSQFGGTYNIAKSKGSTIDGHLVSKKLTFKGTDAAESLVGGQNKTTFKGGGGPNSGAAADTLVGGSGKDTFFYAKGDKGNVTIANFDFDNDKLKIAGGTINKIESLESGVQFAMKNGRGDSPAVGWFKVTSSAKAEEYNNGTPPAGTAITPGNVLIKANNTYYWFAQSTVTLASDSLQSAKVGDLITWDKKVSKSDIGSGAAVIELNYSTNLVKAGVASVVSSSNALPNK